MPIYIQGSGAVIPQPSAPVKKVEAPPAREPVSEKAKIRPTQSNFHRPEVEPVRFDRNSFQIRAYQQVAQWEAWEDQKNWIRLDLYI